MTRLTRIAPLTALLALISLPGVTVGQSWESVAKAESKEAFVDPASVKDVAGSMELRAKENFASPQPSAKKGKTYLSADNSYRFDCAGRKVAIKSMLAYPEADLQGKVVQKATFGDKNLQWMDAPKDTVFGNLLNYACYRTPSEPAAPGNPQ